MSNETAAAKAKRLEKKADGEAKKATKAANKVKNEKAAKAKKATKGSYVAIRTFISPDVKGRKMPGDVFELTDRVAKGLGHNLVRPATKGEVSGKDIPAERARPDEKGILRKGKQTDWKEADGSSDLTDLSDDDDDDDDDDEFDD